MALIPTPGRVMVHSGEYGEFERSVGLPQNFVLDLLKESDWSFLIKLHALTETGLTRALVRHFAASKALAEHLAELGVGGPTGKIKLAYDAGLIDKGMRQFLDRFAELRNVLVHRVENVRLSLADYVKSLDNKQRKQLIAAVAFDGDKVGREKLLMRDPHMAFIHAAMAVLERLAGGGIRMHAG